MCGYGNETQDWVLSNDAIGGPCTGDSGGPIFVEENGRCEEINIYTGDR